MTMAMELIRHIAGLYSGKAIKGDFTQVYITGNEIWMAQQILASQQVEDAQGERETFEAVYSSLDLSMWDDAWGMPAYRHSHVDALWEGWQARAALAQPSPIRCQCCGYLVTDSEHRSCLRAAQQPSPAPELEQVERFEPAHGTDRGGNVFAYMIDNEAGEYMEFAQHERIVGALREKIDGAESQAEYQTRRAEHFAKERDAVLSRLAELEKQAPVTAVSEETFSADGTSDIITRNLPIGTMLYAAPVAQAGQVPEVAGIGRDVAHPRAVVLYLRKEPTDDDLRAIQVGLRMLAAAPAQGGE